MIIKDHGLFAPYVPSEKYLATFNVSLDEVADPEKKNKGIMYAKSETGRDFYELEASGAFADGSTLASTDDTGRIIGLSIAGTGIVPRPNSRLYELQGEDVPVRIEEISGKVVDATGGRLLDPPPPVPASLNRRQFYTGLALRKLISEDEALAAVGDGRNIPARLQTFIDGITDLTERFSTKMLLAGADIHRDHPLTAKVATGIGWKAPEIDEFFHFAATL